MLAYFLVALLSSHFFPIEKPIKGTANFLIQSGALLLGFSTGLRALGVYFILPATLIKTQGALPSWYGYELFLYGIRVGFSQIPILFFKFKPPIKLSIGMLYYPFLFLPILNILKYITS